MRVGRKEGRRKTNEPVFDLQTTINVVCNINHKFSLTQQKLLNGDHCPKNSSHPKKSSAQKYERVVYFHTLLGAKDWLKYTAYV